jgi:hypothetical protein
LPGGPSLQSAPATADGVFGHFTIKATQVLAVNRKDVFCKKLLLNKLIAADSTVLMFGNGPRKDDPLSNSHSAFDVNSSSFREKPVKGFLSTHLDVRYRKLEENIGALKGGQTIDINPCVQPIARMHEQKNPRTKEVEDLLGFFLVDLRHYG